MLQIAVATSVTQSIDGKHCTTPALVQVTSCKWNFIPGDLWIDYLTLYTLVKSDLTDLMAF